MFYRLRNLLTELQRRPVTFTRRSEITHEVRTQVIRVRACDVVEWFADSWLRLDEAFFYLTDDEIKFLELGVTQAEFDARWDKDHPGAGESV